MEEKGNTLWTNTSTHLEHSLLPLTLLLFILLLLHIFLTSTMALYLLPWLSSEMTIHLVNTTRLHPMAQHALLPQAGHYHLSIWVTLLVQECTALSSVTTLLLASILR